MARPRKTPTGAPAQPLAAPTGQPYGEQGAQLEAQRAVPMEDTRHLAEQQLTQAAQQFVGQQVAADGEPILARPDQMPASPMTAGMGQGAGPGPEALGAIAPVDRTADVIRLAAAASANPRLLRLQRLIEARNGAQPPLSPYATQEY